MKTSENITVTNYKLQYIADPMGLAAIYVVNTPLTPLLELSPTISHHTDHVSILINIDLGSITEITNEQGQLVQRIAYNAWGVRELIRFYLVSRHELSHAIDIYSGCYYQDYQAVCGAIGNSYASDWMSHQGEIRAYNMQNVYNNNINSNFTHPLYRAWRYKIFSNSALIGGY